MSEMKMAMRMNWICMVLDLGLEATIDCPVTLVFELASARGTGKVQVLIKIWSKFESNSNVESTTQRTVKSAGWTHLSTIQIAGNPQADNSGLHCWQHW